MTAGVDHVSIVFLDLVLSGVAAFCAIMLWSLIREPAWMLVIIGTILRFGEVVFQTLSRFGIIVIAEVELAGLPLFWLLMRGVPLLFVIAGIVVMIRNLRV